MPGVIANDKESRKRKRQTTAQGDSDAIGARKAPRTRTTTIDGTQSRIRLLEEQIIASQEHYNNILELQKLVNNADKERETAHIAAIALCRAFCRLIAGEKLTKRKGTSASASATDVQIVQWLKARLRDYAQSLLGWIGSSDATRESIALTLLMQVVKREASGGGSKKSESSWRNDNSTFVALLRRLLHNSEAHGARQEFVDKFVEANDDVRFYTFTAVKQLLNEHDIEHVAANAIDMLSQLEGIPDPDNALKDWYAEKPESKHQLLSLNAHRKAAREAWVSVFRSSYSFEHLETILAVTTTHVLPWFAGHIELLTDFLTDAFNQGGSMALLALSGIFNMMTQKNLDYPDFYTKLYSLLDEDLLHSKHRSRFFRLLETFMASTHLPVVMVASFVKRLSRLALHSPPGGIVWTVPWVYNMLKAHPPCTFMLHRTPHPTHAIYASHPQFEEEGMDDPFDMNQSDPMLTGAIDSSLWELETLQSHFHPNVATLARIMGEQFTKRDYQLDDFLQCTYKTLVDAELDKDMKRAPVVEWEIPKRIVMTDEGHLNDIGSLLQAAVDAR